MEARRGIGRQIDGEIYAGRAHRDQARPQQQLGFLRSENFANGSPRGCALKKFGCFVYLAPYIKAHWAYQQSEQEWHPPSPSVQLMRSECSGETDPEQRCEQLRHILAGKLPAGEESLACRRMLDHEGGRAAELTRYSEPLQQPGCENTKWRERADRSVGRHEDHH